MTTLREHLEAIRDERNRMHMGEPFSAYCESIRLFTAHADAALAILDEADRIVRDVLSDGNPEVMESGLRAIFGYITTSTEVTPMTRDSLVRSLHELGGVPTPVGEPTLGDPRWAQAFQRAAERNRKDA